MSSKSSHILNVLKQALITFSNKTHTQNNRSENFATNLETLVALLDKTTAADVNLPSQFANPQLWACSSKAPVSCIEIYEDNHLTMGIFILKPNGKLPLHNHPQMHGLIKVIAGQVQIVSYSINTEKTKEIDQKSASLQNHQNQQQFPIKIKSNNTGGAVITAELNDKILTNSSSPTCVLEPNYKNLHEIQSLDEPAAFLDILAPPYDSELSDEKNSSGPCSYYAKLSQVAPNIFRFQEIRSPSWYWTDSHPYTGPDLYDVKLSS